MTEPKYPYIPFEVYLQHEETALLKSEYLNGAVIPMGGNNIPTIVSVIDWWLPCLTV